VRRAVQALLDHRMVVLKVPADLPWRYELRSAVEMSFRQNTTASNILVEPIDAEDECREGGSPGNFLLQRFARSGEVRNGYRERSRVTIQSYLIQNEVLNHRIIWVKGLSGKQAEEWVDFCKQYPASDGTTGLFVLEIHGANSCQDSKRISVIDLNNGISSYDVQLFNSFILGESRKYTDPWRQYISTVAASLCKADGEVSAQLLADMDFRTEEPVEGIRRLADDPSFEQRGTEEPDHVLYLCRQGREDALTQRVWSAQVQVLFPLIELERIRIIQEIQPELEETLQKHNVSQYGEQITDPMDVELGTLDYLLHSRGEDDLYKLYIAQEELRDRIGFLHQCRNQLAHANLCTPEQVARIIEGDRT
jgi:hypothetical protein